MNSTEIFTQLMTLAKTANDESVEHFGEPMSQDYMAALADVAEFIFNLDKEQIEELHWYGQEAAIVTSDESETDDGKIEATPVIATSPVIAVGGINVFTENEAPIVTRFAERPSGNICTKCGCSERHGAMFTTIKNGDTCDDCI